jgi:hypothetical protein
MDEEEQMRRIYIVIVILLVILSGCAGRTYYKLETSENVIEYRVHPGFSYVFILPLSSEVSLDIHMFCSSDAPTPKKWSEEPVNHSCGIHTSLDGPSEKEFDYATTEFLLKDAENETHQLAPYYIKKWERQHYRTGSSTIILSAYFDLPSPPKIIFLALPAVLINGDIHKIPVLTFKHRRIPFFTGDWGWYLPPFIVSVVGIVLVIIIAMGVHWAMRKN